MWRPPSHCIHALPIGALAVGIFSEDWTDDRCKKLIETCSEGEHGKDVPKGTSPHLVASAIKYYLSHMDKVILDKAILEKVGANAGKRPSEIEARICKRFPICLPRTLPRWNSCSHAGRARPRP